MAPRDPARSPSGVKSRLTCAPFGRGRHEPLLRRLDYGGTAHPPVRDSFGGVSYSPHCPEHRPLVDLRRGEAFESAADCGAQAGAGRRLAEGRLTLRIGKGIHRRRGSNPEVGCGNAGRCAHRREETAAHNRGRPSYPCSGPHSTSRRTGSDHVQDRPCATFGPWIRCESMIGRGPSWRTRIFPIAPVRIDPVTGSASSHATCLPNDPECLCGYSDSRWEALFRVFRVISRSLYISCLTALARTCHHHAEPSVRRIAWQRTSTRGIRRKLLCYIAKR